MKAAQNWLMLEQRIGERLATLMHVPFGRSLATLLAHSGDASLWLLLGGGLWWWGDGRLALAGAHIVITVIVNWVVCTIIKFVVRRPRPSVRDGAFYLKADRYAFPSGHAMRVGGLWIALLPGLFLAGQVALVFWGVVVCVCRVALRLHHVGDVLAGVVLGAWVGLLLII